MRPRIFQLLAIGGLILLTVSSVAMAADDGALKDSIKKAAQLLKDRKVAECAELIDECTKKIQDAVAASQPKDLGDLRKLHSQIAKAHELLAVEGADLAELPSWDALVKAKKAASSASKEPKGTKKPNANPDKPTPGQPPVPTTQPTAQPGGPVSFTRDLAPWMVEQCGRCHVNADRGGFSLATYNALIKGSKGGVVLFPGDAVGSRIVETIETGDMPRGGGKVSPENLNKLKQWIIEGAKFDGPMPDAPIATLVGNKDTTKPATPEPEAMAIATATGKETVSFSKDIAPILIANCNGCHYNGTRVNGGLVFNTFVGLAKGGTSGKAIEATKPDESLLIKKLRGTAGARMPQGRAALPDEQIQLVETWIKEGATFDGYNKDAKLDQVVGQAWASKATHEDLMSKRMERAREKWKLVSPKSEVTEINDSQIHVIGDIGPESAKALLAQANSAIGQIRKSFKINSKEPLIRGGFTIYAMKQRYDYSEFGTMIESRSLPTEWSGHWRKEVLDVYIAMVFDKSESKINETSLVQHITSLWVGSFEKTPKWFADGAGRQTLALLVGPNDARVQPWLRRLPESMEQLKNLKPFLEGTMNDEDSATIGFGVIRFMHESKMKTQYDAIVKGLLGGASFDDATKKAIGPVDVFLQQVTGKAK